MDKRKDSAKDKTGKKEKKLFGRHIEFRFFILAFAFTAAFFGIIAILIIYLLMTPSAGKSSGTGNSSSPPASSALSDYVDASDTSNILICVNESTSGNLYEVVLARLDAVKKRFTVMAVPLELATGNGSESLSDAFTSGGIGEVKSDLTSLTSVDIDYTFLINSKSFPSIVDNMGGLDFNVPEDVSATLPEDGRVFTLNSGLKKLDGATVLALMNYSSYSVSGNTKYTVQAGLMKSFLEDVLKENFLDNLNDNAKVLFNNSQTNMTMSSLQDKLDTLRRVSASTEPVMVLEPTLMTSGIDNGLYDFGTDAKQLFKNDFGAK